MDAYPKHTRHLIGAATAIGLALAIPMTGIAQQEPAIAAAPSSFAEIVRQKLPAVVGIVTTMPVQELQQGAMPQLPPGMGDLFGGPRGAPTPQGPAQALGSG